MNIHSPSPRGILSARMPISSATMIAYLSDAQICEAIAFMDDPYAVALPASVMDVLTSLLVDRWKVGEYESEVGIPGRSARPLLAQALDTLAYLRTHSARLAPERPRARQAPAPDPEDLAAQVEWLTGSSREAEIGAVVAGLKVQRKVAHLYLILRDAKGVPVHRDIIMSRLYAASPDDEPEINIVMVYVSMLRKRLPPGERVETLWRTGYRLVSRSGGDGKFRPEADAPLSES